PREQLPLGIPSGYWLDLKNYDQVRTARQLPQPLLILQGERDYQVTMQDFNGWKKGMKGKNNVTFKSYPKLNHLFMSGEGKSTPDEYMQPGHVDKEVLVDIAGWIKNL
ncbi:MAG: alpha/beta hydrolase, partial [candidate division Zixibacteria bacterium]|nr:alpha/beta hydrolase [candidate division Zixibacteria bacterium]